jgi:hypothetical protein
MPTKAPNTIPIDFRIRFVLSQKASSVSRTQQRDHRFIKRLYERISQKFLRFVQSPNFSSRARDLTRSLGL